MVLLLSLLRFGWRLLSPPPPLPASVGMAQRGLLHAVHAGFYALLLLLPLSGWVIASASPLDLPKHWFGLFAWPDLPLETSRPTARAAAGAHGLLVKLLWALLAGYAARMVPEHQKGRAIAIAMVGTPLPLSLGVPTGTFLGNGVGWRMCFGIMSALALVLMVWVRIKLPDFAGQAAGKRLSLGQVFTVPGICPVLFVVLAFVLAHNILYTYIAPFLAVASMAERTDLVLLVFGVSSLVGIWIGGVLLERLGVGAFAPALLGLLAATLVVVWAARRHGFPAPALARGA